MSHQLATVTSSIKQSRTGRAPQGSALTVSALSICQGSRCCLARQISADDPTPNLIVHTRVVMNFSLSRGHFHLHPLHPYPTCPGSLCVTGLIYSWQQSGGCLGRCSWWISFGLECWQLWSPPLFFSILDPRGCSLWTKFRAEAGTGWHFFFWVGKPYLVFDEVFVCQSTGCWN